MIFGKWNGWTFVFYILMEKLMLCPLTPPICFNHVLAKQEFGAICPVFKWLLNNIFYKKCSRQSKIMTWTGQLFINSTKNYENYFDWRNMDVVSFGVYNFYWRQSADSWCCFLFKGSFLLYMFLQIGKYFGITGWLHLKIPDICGNIFTINLLVAISTLSQVFSATKSMLIKNIENAI